MVPIIGIVVVLFSAIGGFAMAGGNVGILWQPIEVLVIIGSAIGALMIGYPAKKLKALLGEFASIFKGIKYHKHDYLELLVFLTAILKLIKTKGFLAVEQHVEGPRESSLFAKCPALLMDDTLLVFAQEYLRAMSMGVDNPYHLDDVISAEIDQYSKTYLKNSSGVLQNFADSLPALGIVAAVLGVILSMAAISEPPEILGGLIAAALVGTFLGVYVSYGLFGPMAHQLSAINEYDMHMHKCIHQTLTCFLHGYAPVIAVELGRKILPLSVRPSFEELEEAIANDKSS